MAPPPPQLPLDSELLKQSKTVAVYYTWMDSNNTLQTGKTTFSVEATGTTQSDIEKNLHNAICEYLVKIEEDIVYDILKRIVGLINKYIDRLVIGVEKQDSSIVIYLDSSITAEGLVKNIKINLYTINFPLEITENPSSNLVVSSNPVVKNALVYLENALRIKIPKISKILIN